MVLYSYVVARDFGFAPNPFFGVCTLATCKPKIRVAAMIGDWVVGTGSKAYDLDGHLVFAMKVTEVSTYDEYWGEPRFQDKKPNLNGSIKQAYGDNIYHKARNGRWIQADSHHSNSDGSPNPRNIEHDCKAPRVLIGNQFAYWGRSGPKIPRRFRGPNNDICGQRGHKCVFPLHFVASFLEWLLTIGLVGYIDRPAEWK